ncbi:MAG: outer membrane beta-barrel protein [Bacteroidetes bacterium]|nr:outer membrane beta-barrel protein [Bacteroidota bacterium]MBS1972946.1 outer membrane beta-barrel protein [Bacteroidota bacterium]
MHYLLRTKRKALIFFIALCGFVTFSYKAHAQLRDNLNLPDRDSKFYHLGIAIIYNNSHFQATAHPTFLNQDTVLSVNPLNTGGFGLAGMHNFHISDHWEFRVVFPQLMFSYKNLEYNLQDASSGKQSSTIKKVESIYLGFPLHIKFLSDRIDNFRFYMFSGANYQYDLASNASARKAQDLVKLKPYDFSIEAGIGFQFYFPVFILTPEIKISEGLINIHSRDPNLINSSVIDRLNSRMVVFSLIFEG